MLHADGRVVTSPDAHEGFPAPVVYLASLDDSAVTLTVRAWVKSGDYWDVFFHFNEQFYNRLPELAGISFPFPQMDVHINPGTGVKS